MKKFFVSMTLVAFLGTGCQEGAEDSTGRKVDGIQQDDVVAADDGLQLTARPLREFVEVEGPLQVEVTLRNLSDSVVRFRPIFNFGRWLDAEIVDTTGSQLRKTASIDPPNAPAVSLQGGESITDTVDLRCGLPPIPGEDSCMAPYDLSQPGDYQMRMYFTLPCNFGACQESETVEAEPFTVQVEASDN